MTFRSELKRAAQYPGGNPIRRRIVKGQSITRSPGIGPLVPRLRYPELRDAIGFHRFAIPDEEDE